MHWILSPILPLALFVLLIILQMGLFLAVKREQARMRAVQEKAERKWAELHDLHESALERLAAEVKGLQQKDAELIRTAGFSMNLTRRQQVIQMARKGATAATIASALQIPAREVDLLLKVLRGVPPPPAQDRL